MLPTLPHSIVRQVLEVEVTGTEAQAFALHSTLAALCKQTLLPVIEQAFERCGPKDRLIRIDRLELDLGSVALERLEQELPALLQRSLGTALDAHLAARPEPQDGTGSYTTTVAHGMDEALAYFLQWGTLPPALRLFQGCDFEATLRACQDAAGRGALPPLPATLHAALRSSAGIERLAGQFSVAFGRTVLARMGTTWVGALEAAVAQAPARPAGANAGAANEPGHLRPGEPVPAAVERLLLRAALHCAARGGDSSAHVLIRDALALAGASSAAQAALADMLRPNRSTRAARSSPAGSLPAGDLKAAGLQSVQAAAFHHPDREAGIFIENAGLVLLHPFLAPLFEMLAISCGERLLLPSRALAVLHFLASGQDSGPEYALALPKILCALPVTANVEAGIVTCAVEQAEACDMLEAVIAHWSKLQNTSPDGLRGAFLMRPGKLSQRNGEWVLQVEAHAADILLSDLPWGVSAIRLPWMEHILWVEWNSP